MINKKEDLYNTYIINDNGELRDLYLRLCEGFGLHKYNDGDDYFGVEFYDTKVIQCDQYSMPDSEGILQRGVDIDIELTELTLEDLIPQTKEVEWVNGEELAFNGEPCVFIGMFNQNPVVKYTDKADSSLAGCIDEIFEVELLSKPESEAEKLEREELENGEAMYNLVQQLWVEIDSNYTAHPYESPMVDSKVKAMYRELAKVVGYRKGE